MKKLFTLAFTVTLHFALNAQVPGAEKAIRYFSDQFNTQQFDSIYVHYSPSFRSKLPQELNKGMLNQVFQQNGKIKTAELKKSENGQYVYLMTGERGSFEATLTMDESGQISSLRLKPADQKPVTQSKIFPSDNRLETPKEKSIDTEVQRFLNSCQCPGLSIAVVEDKTVNYYNYGETISGSGKLPTEFSVYDIGSISKTFTAAIISQLEEHGKLHLQDSLRKFVKGLQPEIGAITLIQLLNHTSGLPSMPSVPSGTASGKDPFEKYSREQLVNDLRSIKLQSTPGEKFAYSNLGFATVGLIIESVTGKSYAEVLTEKMIHPLRLKATTLNAFSIKEKNQTKGYSGSQRIDYTTLDAMAPAGGIKSNAADLVSYARSLFYSSGKPQPLVEKITFTHANGMNVGLAWLNREMNGNSIYFHNGGTTGYRSFMSYDPLHNKALVLLTNSTTDATSLGFNLTKLL